MSTASKVSIVISMLSLGLSLGSVYRAYETTETLASTRKILQAERALTDAAKSPLEPSEIRPWSEKPQRRPGRATATTIKDGIIAGHFVSGTASRGELTAGVYVDVINGPVIGLSDERTATRHDHAHDLAFFLVEGRPTMQVRTKSGRLEHIEIEELVAIAIEARAKKNDPPKPLPERVIHANR